MIKNISLITVALLVAFGAGTYSLIKGLDTINDFGALHLGAWVAFPLSGTAQADPYAKARIARSAQLPLGGAEGITFIARTDSSGNRLEGNCQYRIEGQIPKARLWTLFAANSNLALLQTSNENLPNTLHSFNVIRQENGTVTINTGPHPHAGNWLAHDKTDDMVFVMSLYETSIATHSSISQVHMPKISKLECDA